MRYSIPTRKQGLNFLLITSAYPMKIFIRLLFAFSVFLLQLSSAQAQPVTWTQVDIGSPGASGTYSYSSGTYTTGGAGVGIGKLPVTGGDGDSFSYVYSNTSGNMEMVAYISSQTNTNSYAVSGLMMRDSSSSTVTSAAQATIGVSPKNGVNFTYRSADGGSSTTILGPSVAAPVWVRLVRSGSTFAGYESSDGLNWNLVGQTEMASFPNSYYVGFAVSSNVHATLSTAVFNQVRYIASIPQRSSNLITWLRADVGVVSSSGKVSVWQDQSAAAYNGLQPNSTNQPTVTTNALNGLPVINFTPGSSGQFFELPSGYGNFSSGASIFLVVEPTANMTGGKFIDAGNASTTNEFGFAGVSNTSAQFSVNNGSSTNSVTASSAFTVNQYKLLEVVHNGNGLATIYTNGVQGAQGSINNIPNIYRVYNYIGQSTSGGSYFQGNIAEILVYNAPVTTTQQAQIESYVYQKYGIGSLPAVPTPVITPGQGVFSSTQSVSISAMTNAQIYYTTDGSTPTTSSTLYTVPFTISASTTVKAIAVSQYFANSAVASAYLQLDPNTANLPTTNLLAWLKSDNGVTTSSSNVTQWTDLTGNGNTFSQSNSSYQPTLTTGAVNGLPAITFNGSSQYLVAPSGFANFTSGASMFIVTKPTSSVTSARFLDIGTGSTTNSFGVCEYSPSAYLLYSFNGSTGSSIQGTLTTSQYQILEAIQNGSGTGSLYTNGTSVASGSVNNINNTTRSAPVIGAYTGGGTYYFQGQIAEILIYSTALSSTQRQAVENYLLSRYGLSIAAPTISPAAGTYTSTQTVTLSTTSIGAQIYYTTNGSTPTTSSTLYTAPFTLTNTATVKAIAAQSFGTSSVSAALIVIDENTAGITTSGLLAWYRADIGVNLGSGSNVASWTDVSGNGNIASQTTSSNQPTLITNAANGYPAINFNPSSSAQYLNMPSGFANFTAGTNLFVVTKPTTANPAFLLYFGNSGTDTSSFGLAEAGSTSGRFHVTNSSGTFSSISGSNALIENQYQLFEATQNSSGLATIYTNAVQQVQSTINIIPNVTRSACTIGTGEYYSYQGLIAEILVYNTNLTTTQRAAIEGYLIAKYQFNNQYPTAPIFSTATSSPSGPIQVAIAAQPNATIYYTLDGTTPTTSSSVYSGPISIYYTQTLKAMANFSNGNQSSVTSATYTLNSTQWPAPNPSDPTPLQIYLQLPTNSVPQ